MVQRQVTRLTQQKKKVDVNQATSFDTAFKKINY